MPILQEQDLLRGHLRDKLDPNSYTERSEEYLEGITLEERLSWFNHPCTKALIYAAEADIAGILSLWIAGGYSNEDSTDATAQVQAKARGMAQALNDIVEFIHDIKTDSQQDEE